MVLCLTIRHARKAWSNLTANSTAYNNNLVTLFEQFIRERVYIANLSPRTIRYSRSCFDSLRQHAPDIESLAEITKDVLMNYVAALRQSGVKPISIDSYVRGLNCFFSWLERNGFTDRQLCLPRPRFDVEMPRTLNRMEIAALVQLKPRTQTMRRVHAIALVCLETGCRVNEVLTLRFEDIDLDAMSLRVIGKGRRERLLPISAELRRILCRWMQSETKDVVGSSQSSLVFATRGGLKLRYDNVRRDYRTLMRNAGIENPGGFHKLRHTFATEFIRSGRGEILLSRILGHTTLEMTGRYVQNNVEDLRGCSPLSRL